MDYTFDSNVAIEVGVEAAVIFQNIAWWCKKNEANQVHFHDGRYWTYNSADAFATLFPFFNRRKIARLLAVLKDSGYIVQGCYNKVKFDRTQWYAVTEKGWRALGLLCVFTGKSDVPDKENALVKNDQCNMPNLVNALDKNDQSQVPDLSNGLVKNVQPIPDINTDSKPDDKHSVCGADAPPEDTPADRNQKSVLKKTFTPPKLDEVRAYVEEKKLSVDAEKFYEYYEAGNWHDGNGKPVKNWKQKCLTWDKHDSGPQRTPPREKAKGYTQEDFDRVAAELERNMQNAGDGANI